MLVTHNAYGLSTHMSDKIDHNKKPPCTNRGVTFFFEKPRREDKLSTEISSRNVKVFVSEQNTRIGPCISDDMRLEKTSGCVDWITGTTTDRRTGLDWMTRFHRHRDAHGQDETKAIRLHGFVGLRCAGLIWAQREADGRFMLIASGDACTRHWENVAKWGHVSRLDLAVDVVLPDCIPDIVLNASRVVMSGAFDLNKIKYTLYTSCSSSKEKGRTLYIGSRQSEQMGRLYDKGVQTGLYPQGQWLRYEIELKANRAITAARDLCNLKEEGYTVDQITRASVHDWYTQRWVIPVFSAAKDCGATIHTRSFARVTTAEKKLAWLTSQVRPTITYLFEIGLGTDALMALGLDVRSASMVQSLQECVDKKIKERR